MSLTTIASQRLTRENEGFHSYISKNELLLCLIQVVLLAKSFFYLPVKANNNYGDRA